MKMVARDERCLLPYRVITGRRVGVDAGAIDAGVADVVGRPRSLGIRSFAEKMPITRLWHHAIQVCPATLSENMLRVYN
jgi:hypothetical protein